MRGEAPRRYSAPYMSLSHTHTPEPISFNSGVRRVRCLPSRPAQPVSAQHTSRWTIRVVWAPAGPGRAGPGRPRQAPAGPWDIVSPGRRPTRAPLTHHTLTSYGRPSAKPAHFSAPARRQGPIARPDLLSASKNQLTRRATFGRTGAPRGSGRWAAAGKGNASQPRMAHTSLAARGTILAQRPMHRLSPSKCQPRRD